MIGKGWERFGVRRCSDSEEIYAQLGFYMGIGEGIRGGK